MADRVGKPVWLSTRFTVGSAAEGSWERGGPGLGGFPCHKRGLNLPCTNFTFLELINQFLKSKKTEREREKDSGRVCF